MSPHLFFTFSEYWSFYLGFVLFVLCMLLLDLGVFHRDAHAVKFKEATAWSVFWIILALSFNYGLHQYVQWKCNVRPELLAECGNSAHFANELALEFLTGYIVEKALSVDNIFIFVVVFSYFGIPAKYQHRILFYGIIGALVFRAIFIALGAVLMQYHLVVMLFGVFLIFTGIKIFFAPEKPLEPEKNPIIKLLKRYLPVTDTIDGQRFFVRRGQVLSATPLFITLVFVELTDIVFAVDSVPAIYAVTHEPFIVFTSNVFAILGLRSLYFMLAGVMDKFHMLKYGLGIILIFVGLKMVWLNDAFGGKFPISWSLGIIAAVLALSIALSFAIPKSKPQ